MVDILTFSETPLSKICIPFYVNKSNVRKFWLLHFSTFTIVSLSYFTHSNKCKLVSLTGFTMNFPIKVLLWNLPFHCLLALCVSSFSCICLNLLPIFCIKFSYFFLLICSSLYILDMNPLLDVCTVIILLSLICVSPFS